MKRIAIKVQPAHERSGSCRRHHPGPSSEVPEGSGPHPVHLGGGHRGGGPRAVRHGGPYPVMIGGPGGRRRRGPRAARGQLRAAVLLLLAEQPRHGYDLITELTDRSEGRWNPSPGAVYPMLRRLADKGLVTVDDVDGRKTFALTAEGEAFVATNREVWGEPWSMPEMVESASEMVAAAARHVVGAAQQVIDVGDEDQQQRAKQILDRTRKELFGLLAE